MTPNEEVQAAAEKKETKRVRHDLEMRWAYVVLAMISIILSGAVLVFGIKQVKDSDHKFCQLIVASLGTAPPPVKPPDPKVAKAQEKLYEDYVIVRDLGHNLGCL